MDTIPLSLLLSMMTVSQVNISAVYIIIAWLLVYTILSRSGSMHAQIKIGICQYFTVDSFVAVEIYMTVPIASGVFM